MEHAQPMEQRVVMAMAVWLQHKLCKPIVLQLSHGACIVALPRHRTQVSGCSRMPKNCALGVGANQRMRNETSGGMHRTAQCGVPYRMFYQAGQPHNGRKLA